MFKIKDALTKKRIYSFRKTAAFGLCAAAVGIVLVQTSAQNGTHVSASEITSDSTTLVTTSSSTDTSSTESTESTDSTDTTSTSTTSDDSTSSESTTSDLDSTSSSTISDDIISNSGVSTASTTSSSKEVDASKVTVALSSDKSKIDITFADDLTVNKGDTLTLVSDVLGADQFIQAGNVSIDSTKVATVTTSTDSDTSKTIISTIKSKDQTNFAGMNKEDLLNLYDALRNQETKSKITVEFDASFNDFKNRKISIELTKPKAVTEGVSRTNDLLFPKTYVNSTQVDSEVTEHQQPVTKTNHVTYNGSEVLSFNVKTTPKLTVAHTDHSGDQTALKTVFTTLTEPYTNDTVFKSFEEYHRRDNVDKDLQQYTQEVYTTNTTLNKGDVSFTYNIDKDSIYSVNPSLIGTTVERTVTVDTGSNKEVTVYSDDKTWEREVTESELSGGSSTKRTLKYNVTFTANSVTYTLAEPVSIKAGENGVVLPESELISLLTRNPDIAKTHVDWSTLTTENDRTYVTAPNRDTVTKTVNGVTSTAGSGVHYKLQVTDEFGLQGFGDNVTGTVKVKYLDAQTNKEIKASETIVDNKSWNTAYSVTPPTIDGYAFTKISKTSASLTGLTGKGESTVVLLYTPTSKTATLKEVYTNSDITNGVSSSDVAGLNRIQDDKSTTYTDSDFGKYSSITRTSTHPGKIVSNGVTYVYDKSYLVDGTSSQSDSLDTVTLSNRETKQLVHHYTKQDQVATVTEQYRANVEITETPDGTYYGPGFTIKPNKETTIAGSDRFDSSGLTTTALEIPNIITSNNVRYKYEHVISSSSGTVKFGPDEDSAVNPDTEITEDGVTKYLGSGVPSDSFSNRRVRVGDDDVYLHIYSPERVAVSQSFVATDGTVISDEIIKASKTTNDSSDSSTKANSVSLSHPEKIVYNGVVYAFKSQDKADVIEIPLQSDTEKSLKGAKIDGETAKSDVVLTYAITYTYEKVETPAPKVTTEEIPFETITRKDSSIDSMTAKVLTQGEKGVKTTTITYTLDETTGEYKENAPVVEITKSPVDKVVVYNPTGSRETPVPYETKYVQDDSLEAGQKVTRQTGVTGLTTETITDATLDMTDPSNPKVINPVYSSPVTTTEKQDEIITIGAKPKVEVVKVPYETVYKEDPTLDANQQVVEVEGSEGVSTTTTTYTVDLTNGSVTENTPTTETVAPVTRVIRVGTKTVVEKTPIPFDTIRKAVTDLPDGKERTKQEGVTGETVKTTTYTVDPKTGVVTPSTTTTTTPKQDKIIEYGTTTPNAPTITTEVIPSTPKYVFDESKPKGSEETTPGKDGSRTTTITYTVDEHGNQVPSTPTVEETPATPTIITKGTKPSVETNVIPHEVTYIPDDSLEAGKTVVETKGKDGKTTTTTTYTGDSNTGVVTPNTPTTTTENPVTEVIRVGTKTVVEKTPIPYNTSKVKVTDLPEGKERVKQEGVPGEVVKTTTYTVNPKTGEVTSNTTTTTTPKQDKIIEYGTTTPKSPTVTTEVIPSTPKYEFDENLPKGSEEVTKGKDGSRKTTVTYTVDEHGNQVPGTPVVEETPSTPTVIRKGTKATVETKVTPHKVTYVPDDSLEVGKTVVETKGKDGKVTTTTTYTGNPTTGEVTPNTPTSTTEEPVTEVIRVGTKSKVTTEVIKHSKEFRDNPNLPEGETRVVQKGKDGSKTTTTTYTVDPNTGKVTSNTTTNEVVDSTDEIVEVGTKKAIVSKDDTPKSETPKVETTSTTQVTKTVERPTLSRVAARHELPNTGESDTKAAGILGLMTLGLGVVGFKKRKNNEE